MGDKAAIFGQVHGFSTTFKFGTGFLLAAAIVSAVLINAGKDSVVETPGGGAL